MKIIYFFSFLLVSIVGFCYQAYLADQASHHRFLMVPCNQASYHHFLMVHAWPKSFCLTHPCVNAQNNFTLHGMWPAASNGQLVMNFNAKPPNMLRWLKNNVFRSPGYGRLEKVWPTLNPNFWKCNPTMWWRWSSADFWIHQWNKHGICSKSTLNASQYFQSAIAQKDNIDLLQALRAAPYNINPSHNINYSRSDIEKAVSQRIGAQAYISCGLPRNMPVLSEIYICLDYHMINYINCSQNNYGRQCPADTTHPNINFPPYKSI